MFPRAHLMEHRGYDSVFNELADLRVLDGNRVGLSQSTVRSCQAYQAVRANASAMMSSESTKNGKSTYG